jgi:hypothetical protein
MNIGCNTCEKIDFTTEVRPILNKHCIACHGGVKKRGGIIFLFDEGALVEGESGRRAIVPGIDNASEFIRRLHEEAPELWMPYEKLALIEEIDLFERWVNQGA